MVFVHFVPSLLEAGAHVTAVAFVILGGFCRFTLPQLEGGIVSNATMNVSHRRVTAFDRLQATKVLSRRTLFGSVRILGDRPTDAILLLVCGVIAFVLSLRLGICPHAACGPPDALACQCCEFRHSLRIARARKKECPLVVMAGGYSLPLNPNKKVKKVNAPAGLEWLLPNKRSVTAAVLPELQETYGVLAARPLSHLEVSRMTGLCRLAALHWNTTFTRRSSSCSPSRLCQGGCSWGAAKQDAETLLQAALIALEQPLRFSISLSSSYGSSTH